MIAAFTWASVKVHTRKPTIESLTHHTAGFTFSFPSIGSTLFVASFVVFGHSTALQCTRVDLEVVLLLLLLLLLLLAEEGVLVEGERVSSSNIWLLFPYNYLPPSSRKCGR